MKAIQKRQIAKLYTRIDLGNEFKEFAKQKRDVSEIEVLTEGYWEHPEYGVIEITEEDIDKFVANFNEKVRKIDIAVDQEHKPDLGAAGWFRKLKKVVDDGVTKLKAEVEWTDMGVDLLKKNIYKYFSPEFDFEYEDYETHEIYENVLLGGALTNRPYFKSLAPVQLSENIFVKLNERGGEYKMTKDELFVRLEEDKDFVLPEDATEEEKAAFEEAKRELEAKLAEKADADAENEEEEVEAEKKDEEVKEEEKEVEEPEEEKEPEDTVKASETFSAKEFNDLRSKIGVLEKKLKFEEVGKQIQGYTFSESNPEGRLLPKSKEVARTLLMSLSDRQSKLFTEFVNSLPKMSALLFEEVGGDEGKSVKASEELDTKANELAKEQGITFGQALKKVVATNPELAKNLQE